MIAECAIVEMPFRDQLASLGCRVVDQGSGVFGVLGRPFAIAATRYGTPTADAKSARSRLNPRGTIRALSRGMRYARIRRRRVEQRLAGNPGSKHLGHPVADLQGRGPTR
jgi:hypothetical protein